MNSRAVKGGFTLVEILAAIAIIVAIVSMLYGSYFAVSRSTQAHNAKMAESGNAQQVLLQVARQIRCAYAQSTSCKENEKSENRTNYFSGNSDDPSGEILHLVTTNAIFKDSQLPNGLFEVTYQFDKSRGLLYVSQERFTGTYESVSTERNWWLLARKIESVQFAFFDGKQWLHRWDFKEQEQLPHAVKINLTFSRKGWPSPQNENYQQYCYSTTAYICCQKNRDKKTLSDTLVSVDKR